jgi:hypothetical protein
MIDTIAKELVTLEYLDASVVGKRVFRQTLYLNNAILTKRAEFIAATRAYPSEMANRTIAR